MGRQELREEHSGEDKETGDHLCKRLLKKGKKRRRAQISSGGRATEGGREREQLARDKKHGSEGKTTSYYSN